jgi:hypothetical protein
MLAIRGGPAIALDEVAQRTVLDADDIRRLKMRAVGSGSGKPAARTKRTRRSPDPCRRPYGATPAG